MSTTILEQSRPKTLKTAVVENAVLTGTVERLPSGCAFLRQAENSYLPSTADAYLSSTQVRRFGLMTGMTVEGRVRPEPTTKKPAITQITSIDGRVVDARQEPARRRFEDLTSVHADDRFHLEMDPADITNRVLGLLTPIGKGQRGLIVSPLGRARRCCSRPLHGL